jgi:hypothetical protein
VSASVLMWESERGSPWEQGWALWLVTERAWALGRAPVWAMRWEQVLGWLSVSLALESMSGKPVVRS